MKLVASVALGAILLVPGVAGAQSPEPSPIPVVSWLDYVRQTDGVLQAINFEGLGSSVESQRLWLPIVRAIVSQEATVSVESHACLDPAVEAWRAALADLVARLDSQLTMLASPTVTDQDTATGIAAIKDPYLNLYLWNEVVWPVMDACRTAGEIEY
jgi:hypothetical protein